MTKLSQMIDLNVQLCKKQHFFLGSGFTGLWSLIDFYYIRNYSGTSCVHNSFYAKQGSMNKRSQKVDLSVKMYKKQSTFISGQFLPEYGPLLLFFTLYSYSGNSFALNFSYAAKGIMIKTFIDIWKAFLFSCARSIALLSQVSFYQIIMSLIGFYHYGKYIVCPTSYP